MIIVHLYPQIWFLNFWDISVSGIREYFEEDETEEADDGDSGTSETCKVIQSIAVSKTIQYFSLNSLLGEYSIPMCCEVHIHYLERTDVVLVWKDQQALTSGRNIPVFLLFWRLDDVCISTARLARPHHLHPWRSSTSPNMAAKHHPQSPVGPLLTSQTLILRLAALFWQLRYNYPPANKPQQVTGHSYASQVKGHPPVSKVNPLTAR